MEKVGGRGTARVMHRAKQEARGIIKGSSEWSRKREMVLSTLDALIGEIVFKPGLKYWRTLAMQRRPHKQVGTTGAKAGGTVWILAEGSLCGGDRKGETVRRLRSRRALDYPQTTAAPTTLLAHPIKHKTDYLN